MSWKCPCGCALKLTPEDEAKERALAERLGSAPRSVTLRAVSNASARPVADPEPIERGICRSCGAAIELPAFLADFLRANRARWPECEACVRRDRERAMEAA